MACKTVGRDYLVWPEDGEVPQRGIYFFAKYHECKNCGRKVHIYLDTNEACEFVYNAAPRLDRRSVWGRIKEHIPHFRIVMEKGSEKKKAVGIRA